MPAPLLAVIAVLVAGGAWHAGVLQGVLAVAVMAGWYSWSLWRSPLRDCWHCRRGSRPDRIASGAYGNCWVCRRTGRRVRWGVRVFRRDTYKAIKAGKHGRNY